MGQAARYEQDLASIRFLMEKSTKFTSLNGISGVLAGMYSLIGSVAAYYLSYYPYPLFSYHYTAINNPITLAELVLIALAVIFASVFTGLWCSHRKAKRTGTTLWTAQNRKFAMRLGLPLLAGGIFVLVMVCTDHFALAAPACLLFYGLALLQASDHTFTEIRYLAIAEILLGLIASFLPGYGLVFWAAGFGVLHILFGAILFSRYDL